METVFILIALALLVFFLEIFVPGGFLFIFGVLLLIVASIMGFVEFGAETGSLIAVASTILAVGMFFLEVKVLTKGPFAKSFVNRTVIKSQSVQQVTPPDIVGKIGVASTALAPGGYVEVDGARYEAKSRTGFVDRGESVKIVAFDNYKITVDRT